LPEGPAPIRGRVIAILALVALVAGSGYLLDRKGPRAAVVGPIENTQSGAWFCPHGGTGGARGWVVIANPGQRDVVVRVTTFGKNGVRALSSLSVPAGDQVYHEVPATEPGASTEVEYFGGWVGASAVVEGGTKSKPGLAGERCAPATRRTWFLPDQPTGRDETAYAVVMNPFSTPAQFNVVIRTERRTINPSSLTPFVLPPRSSVGIKLNEYALESPGQTTVTTQVIQQIGRVVAGSFALTPGSLRAEVGLPALELRWVVPGSDQAPSGEVPLMNPGSVRTDVTVIRQGSTVQEVLSGEDGLSLAPGFVSTFKADRLSGAGLLVESTNRGRIATAAILTGPGADTATMDGTSTPARAWLVLPTLPAEGGQGVLILQNPGRRPVDVSIRLIGANGRLELTGAGLRTIPAARTVVVPLQTVSGVAVSAIVVGKGGTFVAAGASYVGDGAGYAATLGVPMIGAG
jgi:hypothetical protein